MWFSLLSAAVASGTPPLGPRCDCGFCEGVMGYSDEQEKRRLRYISERHGLQTVEHLDALLDADPKTKDDPALRERWRRKLQAANPHLRDA